MSIPYVDQLKVAPGLSGWSIWRTASSGGEG